MTLRVRFAPSPTGDLHLGGTRTALFNWLFARNRGGEFLIRLEDTDRQRSTKAAEQSILDGLYWLGLDSDDAIARQSEFDHYHHEAIEQLLRQGRAYPCYCSPEELEAMRASARKAGEKPRYDGRCRDLQGAPPAGRAPVIRFRGPIEGSTVYSDLVYGDIEIAHSELDDLILRRADGTPTYNLCCAVDDLRMGISHVIRGADHIGNTPRQILLAQALGRRSSAIRPSAADSEPRRSEDVETARRRRRVGLPRTRLPAGGGDQLSGPARLVTWRPRALSATRARRAVFTGQGAVVTGYSK